MSNFNFQRKMPFNVLLLEVGFPLVEVAGKRIDTLREDFYDNAVNSVNNSRKTTHIVSPYDIALSGGEPYGIWR